MSNTTFRASLPSDHAVQFFDTDESRAHHVAAFLAEGYAAGESLVVVARPVNWAAIIEPLERFGVPVQSAASAGRLVVRDADDTLRRLVRHGSPDKSLFKEVVAHQLASLALTSGHRVRAYGEMVDLLAQRGDFNDVIALENLWNGLSERVPIFLLCGYSSAHFVSTTTHAALRDICRCHAGVHRQPEDPLAAWVLTAAHNGPSGGDSLRH
jgi:MEDS: MEthanogen/methylotroph, DcmR Sensory domain